MAYLDRSASTCAPWSRERTDTIRAGPLAWTSQSPSRTTMNATGIFSLISI